MTTYNIRQNILGLCGLSTGELMLVCILPRSARIVKPNADAVVVPAGECLDCKRTRGTGSSLSSRCGCTGESLDGEIII